MHIHHVVEIADNMEDMHVDTDVTTEDRSDALVDHSSTLLHCGKAHMMALEGHMKVTLTLKPLMNQAYQRCFEAVELILPHLCLLIEQQV